MITAIAIILVVSGLILRYLFVWSPVNTGDYFFKQPLVFAHRGLLHQAPENTLAAYTAAVRQGVAAIEMDVVMTSDGEIICSHNFDLERETDGTGFVDDRDSNYIKNIKAGVRHHSDKTERLITPEEAIEKIPSHIRLNIEIKTKRVFDIKTAMKVARMIKNLELQQRTIISSFNPFAIWAVKWVDRRIITGFVLQTMDYFHFTNIVHPDCLHPTAELVTADLLKYARDRGVKVNVWTVNNKPAIDWLIDLGVDGIITDRPEYAPIDPL